MFHFLNAISRLKDFHEKNKTSSAGKKISYLFVTLLQLAIAGGFTFLTYFFITKSENSSLGIFMIILAVAFAICGFVLLIYCIIKLIMLLCAALRKKT